MTVHLLVSHPQATLESGTTTSVHADRAVEPDAVPTLRLLRRTGRRALGQLRFTPICEQAGLILRLEPGVFIASK